jgi:hypothetical protein
MILELDVDSKLALAEAGFKPICSIGRGMVGERWIFSSNTFGLVCGELASTEDLPMVLAIKNVSAANVVQHRFITRVVSAGELVPGIYGAIFDTAPSDTRLVSTFHESNDNLRLDLIKQLSDVISYLHKSGIVHGALAPHVVMHAESGLKLGDFWWSHDTQARPLNEDLTDRIWVNVPAFAAAFAAPELLAGEVPSRESDIFALGATFYWLLTGMQPRPLVSMRTTSLGRIRPLLELNPDIDAELASLIHLMLEENPRDRPIAPWMAGMVDHIVGAVTV